MKGENLYCPGQRGVNEVYRRRFDDIEWDTGKEDPDEELDKGERERD